jgi:hypothetical protein
MNYLAIMLSGVAAMIVGYVWYGPLFGKPWMKLVGMTKEKMEAAKKDMPKSYGMMFVGALVLAYVLAWLLNRTDAMSMADGLLLGFLVWLGLIATYALSSVLFENKPWKLYAINVGYYLVTILVMVIILVTLR